MEKEINYAIHCKWNKKHDGNICKYFKEPLNSLNLFFNCHLQLLYLPTEVTVVPLDGEICSNLGSIKGVKEEEDLCFWSVLLADWVCNVNFNFININDNKKHG